MPSVVKLLRPVDGTPARTIPGKETSPRSALITATCRAVELKFGTPIPRISLAGEGTASVVSAPPRPSAGLGMTGLPLDGH
jgi:hypothetical protein